MTLSTEELTLIRKYAIKNAVDYGKASVGSVLGKAMSQIEESRSKFQEIKSAVETAVSEVNAMAKDALDAEYKSHESEFASEYKHKVEATAKPKIIIEGAVEGSVITRFPPEPGGYIHIGNLKQCMLSDEVARMYKGSIYLYFDDTNPEKCRQEYVDAIKNDTSWMSISFGKEYYASDNIDKIYESGKKLLEQGDAYVCFCTKEEIEHGRTALSACTHRNSPPETNISAFGDMLAGKYDEGQAIVRLKGDMASENASFRDPTLFRIKKVKHYKQGDKYIVWPTYHMNTPVIDSMYGVTDVIRGKEYEIWEPVNRKLLGALGITPPRMHYEARLRIKGTVTGKRDVRKLIDDKKISSWDDPRLLTVAALRRRGVQPEAIREFVLRFGMSKTDSFVNIDMLLAENKKYIDPIAKHLFFVKDPIKVTIKDGTTRSASMKLNPSGTPQGTRDYEPNGVVYVSGDDAINMHVGDAIRLKDFADVSVSSINEKGDIEAALADQNGHAGKIVQWVPDNDHVECSVTIPKMLVNENGEIDVKDSLELVNGYVEGFAKNLNERDIVQFERFGYCTLDKKETMSFIYLSR